MKHFIEYVGVRRSYYYTGEIRRRGKPQRAADWTLIFLNARPMTKNEAEDIVNTYDLSPAFIISLTDQEYFKKILKNG